MSIILILDISAVVVQAFGTLVYSYCVFEKFTSDLKLPTWPYLQDKDLLRLKTDLAIAQ